MLALKLRITSPRKKTHSGTKAFEHESLNKARIGNIHFVGQFVGRPQRVNPSTSHAIVDPRLIVARGHRYGAFLSGNTKTPRPCLYLISCILFWKNSGRRSPSRPRRKSGPGPSLPASSDHGLEWLCSWVWCCRRIPDVGYSSPLCGRIQQRGGHGVFAPVLNARIAPWLQSSDENAHIASPSPKNLPICCYWSRRCKWGGKTWRSSGTVWELRPPGRHRKTGQKAFVSFSPSVQATHKQFLPRDGFRHVATSSVSSHPTWQRRDLQHEAACEGRK